jgi:xylulose-5-phosphate/fructose-6-phosphate phosphoketolase
MCVLNDLDRFHLVSDVIDHVPKLGARAAYTATIRSARR